MKKKKQQLSGQASSDEPSADYVVGQVSGSLFQNSSSGSLASLFSSASPASSLLFQPAPKPVPCSVKEKEKEGDGTPNVKDKPGQTKKKKQLKEKSAAEENLEKRESALQKADEEENDQETSNKKNKKKRTASESDIKSSTEYWVEKRQRLKATKKEEEEKKKRTVFVGNLPVSCTKKMLRSLFKDKGSIESIRFRSVVREDPSVTRKVAAIKRQIHPKKQSVNAYMVFKDEEGVTAALESNGVEIEKDFYIRVDRVTDSSSHDHKRSVFVGNLSFEITELVFRRHFEQCGSVEAVRLIRDPDSGLGKGFGYILFESADSVQLALELDGSKLEGRSVRVKRSVKKDKQKKSEKGKPATGKPSRGPANQTGPKTARGGRTGTGRGSFTGGRQRPAKKGSNSFRGETADPRKKMNNKKGLKKKKPRHARRVKPDS